MNKSLAIPDTEMGHPSAPVQHPTQLLSILCPLAAIFSHSGDRNKIFAISSQQRKIAASRKAIHPKLMQLPKHNQDEFVPYQ